MNKRLVSYILLLSFIFTIACPLFTAAAVGQSNESGVVILVRNVKMSLISDASVYVDDKYAGGTNASGRLAVYGYDPGMHNITVVARGYFNNSITSDLKSSPTIVFLTEDPGQSVAPENMVAIIVADSRDTNSGVAGASVYVDGQYAGVTNNNEGKILLDVTGSHDITVAKDKYHNVTAIYNLEKGGTYKIIATPWGGKMSLLDMEIFTAAFVKELTDGAFNTIKLSVVAMLLGICIGLLMGLGRVSPNRLFRGFSSIYVEGVRGLPLTLQLFLIAYGLPFLMNDYFGLQFRLDVFQSAVLALGMNSGSYMGEIFKAGIEAIHKGQMEAARSLGMTYNQSMRFIILPQAVKIVLPALGNEFIALIKDSSIALIISYQEIVWWSRQVGGMYYNTFTPLIAAGVVYLCITIPLGRAVQYIEKKYKVTDARKEGAGWLGINRRKPRKPETKETEA